MGLLRVENLVKHFPVKKGVLGKVTGYVRAVDGVTFNIGENEVFALVGESGSGKTTVAKCILGLLEPTSGRILYMDRDVSRFKGEELKWYRGQVQAVFQNPFLSLNPRMRVEDIIAEPLKVHQRHISKKEVREIVYQTLERVGLSPVLGKRYPNDLSGGQAQRVAIARAIILKPRLLVLDEPTSALDVSVQAQILNLLIELKEELKMSYLIISHDLSTVRYLSDWVGVMYLGKIVELARSEELFEKPLHPYTRALLSAAPEPDPRAMKAKKRLILPGEPPSTLNPPPGCRLHTRCADSMDICRGEEPPLVEYEPEHWVGCWLYHKNQRI